MENIGVAVPAVSVSSAALAVPAVSDAMSGAPFRELERVMRIAADQRGLILTVLAFMIAAILAVPVMVSGSAPLYGAFLGLLVLGASIGSVVFAVRMASALHGGWIAALSAILVLIFGYWALLVLNLQATRELRRAGLRVGFLGVSADQRDAWWRAVMAHSAA